MLFLSFDSLLSSSPLSCLFFSPTHSTKQESWLMSWAGIPGLECESVANQEQTVSPTKCLSSPQLQDGVESFNHSGRLCRFNDIVHAKCKVPSSGNRHFSPRSYPANSSYYRQFIVTAVVAVVVIVSPLEINKLWSEAYAARTRPVPTSTEMYTWMRSRLPWNVLSYPQQRAPGTDEDTCQMDTQRECLCLAWTNTLCSEEQGT